MIVSSNMIRTMVGVSLVINVFIFSECLIFCINGVQCGTNGLKSDETGGWFILLGQYRWWVVGTV